MQFEVPTGYKLPDNYRASVRKMAAAFPLTEVSPADVDIITDLSVKAVEDAIDAIANAANKAETSDQRAIIAQLATSGLESVMPVIGQVMREKIAAYFTHSMSTTQLMKIMMGRKP